MNYPNTSEQVSTTNPLDLPEQQSAADTPRCQKHGTLMLWVQWGTTMSFWDCVECGQEATERAIVDSHARHDAARADATQRRVTMDLEQRLGAACIPDRYQSLSFDTYPATHAEARHNAQLLRSYANTFPESRRKGVSVLLVGNVGTGKTGLAAAVANHVMRMHRMTAVFTTAYGAVRHMRDTWKRKDKSEGAALADLVAPDLLVLDEVGSNVGTDSELSMLFEVINGRYQEQKPIILVGNLPLDDYDAAGGKRPGLRTTLGPRIIDRFRDDGSFTLKFDFPSLRGGER